MCRCGFAVVTKVLMNDLLIMVLSRVIILKPLCFFLIPPEGGLDLATNRKGAI